MINKNTQNMNLSWNSNSVNHQYFQLLQNYILQIVYSCYYRQGWYYTLLTSNYWKEATTPGLSTTIQRMVHNLVYQIQLEGGYKPLQGYFLPLRHPTTII